MLPDAFITHATQGRVRIKIPSKKSDAAYFASLKEKSAALSELPGIQRIEANPLTGSILVLHTLDLEAIDLGLVAQYGEFNQLFRLRESLPVQRPASGRREQSLRENNGQAGSRTGSEIDPKVLAILGFVGVAIIQLKRGHIMMPAITALWYAYSLMKERQREAAGGGE